MKSEGGFIWACKNYGDVQSDSVAQGKELEDKWRWGLACGQQVVPRCGKRDAIALGKAHEMVALQDIPGPSSQLTDEGKVRSDWIDDFSQGARK